jgi:hypothetical protein
MELKNMSLTYKQKIVKIDEYLEKMSSKYGIKLKVLDVEQNDHEDYNTYQIEAKGSQPDIRIFINNEPNYHVIWVETRKENKCKS